jgi:uncharacterized protein (TIGR02646 family)
MRWICKDDIEECLTQAWKNKAEQTTQGLKMAQNDAERRQILNRRTSSDVWREYYALLPEKLKTKCWYCEAEDIRADVPVDHFRPKNKVDGIKDHAGYWWLAFDWENYRCACTNCNSRRNFGETQGGKACHFPLKNPESRAFTPDDIEQLEAEQPDFLDPFNPDDEKLLWFDTDGLPTPRPESDEDQIQKVKNSIDIFHLHEVRITRARNKIRIQVEKEVKKIRNGEGVQEAKMVLRRMVRDTEKLSRAAIVYLRMHREIPEVKEILQLD